MIRKTMYIFCIQIILALTLRYVTQTKKLERLYKVHFFLKHGCLVPNLLQSLAEVNRNKNRENG